MLDFIKFQAVPYFYYYWTKVSKAPKSVAVTDIFYCVRQFPRDSILSFINHCIRMRRFQNAAAYFRRVLQLKCEAVGVWVFLKNDFEKCIREVKHLSHTFTNMSGLLT